MTISDFTTHISLAVVLVAVLGVFCWPRPRRLARRLFATVGAVVLACVAFLLLGNLLNSVAPGAPHRGLDPQSALCQAGADEGWDILAPSGKPYPYVPNDENDAIRSKGGDWRAKLSCAIQRHKLPVKDDPAAPPLKYDLAFVEIQEDGKPYAVRNPCEAKSSTCVDEGYGLVARGNQYQLEALLERFKRAGQPGADGVCGGEPQYVVVFVHGWRHDASIGDANVEQFRQYLAHAAAYLRQRAQLAGASQTPRVTGVYIGWRGARTNESALRSAFGKVGEWIGTGLAVFTLFDRKPVSEAIAPSALTALRAIEQTLCLANPPPDHAASVRGPNRMIVFGHSLGGNTLATALHDDLVKAIGRHQAGEAESPVLGDLVVLINPASEATKWIDLQRAVWNRIAVNPSERQNWKAYEDSHSFFRSDQRPIFVSVTAARDWPPGGRRERDCAIRKRDDPTGRVDAASKVAESEKLLATSVEYDWATYDLFPAFKLDFRPFADAIQRKLSGVDPHDACAVFKSPEASWWNDTVRFATDLLRFFPYQDTDLEETRTIGNYDPPRAMRGTLDQYFASARPFGTTHELRSAPGGALRKPDPTGGKPEIPVDYDEIGSKFTQCPASDGWLASARYQQNAKYGGHSMFWDSSEHAGPQPALEFTHGFQQAGLAAVTRANDPFWNMRAFDTALARHDGYMLTSFICAMNQLVMDDPVAWTPPPEKLPGDAPAK